MKSSFHIDFVNQHLTIGAFNPFQNLYPRRTVLTRETLNLVKSLREETIPFKIESPYGEKIWYIVAKGEGISIFNSIAIWLREYDPFLWEAFERFIISKLGQYSWKFFKKKYGDKILASIQSTLFTDKYSIEAWLDFSVEYERVLKSMQPDSEFRWPVFHEHTARHIGWAKCYEDLNELKTEARLFDADSKQKLKQGYYKGFSILGLAHDSECSICGENFTVCNHITGKVYENQTCVNHIKQIDLACLGLTTKPINPEAKFS